MAQPSTTICFDVANPHVQSINQAKAKISEQSKASTEQEKICRTGICLSRDYVPKPLTANKREKNPAHSVCGMFFFYVCTQCV